MRSRNQVRRPSGRSTGHGLVLSIFYIFKNICQVYPVLLDIASDGAKNDETRLMSLHCLRDAVDVKPELMVTSAEDIVEKVSFFSENIKK